jgi:hypothetical protein
MYGYIGKGKSKGKDKDKDKGKGKGKVFYVDVMTTYRVSSGVAALIFTFGIK